MKNKIIIVSMAVVLIAATTVGAFSFGSRDKADIKANYKEIAQIDIDTYDAMQKLADREAELRMYEKEIGRVNSEIDLIKNHIDSNNNLKKELEEEIAGLRSGDFTQPQNQ